MAFHKNEAVGSIHIPYAFEYADATARLAATGFVAADVGKLARQTDNNTLWMLTDDSPITWVQIGGTGVSGTITTQEGDITTSASTSTLDFDASDFNLTESPAGEVNIALAYGTSAGTPAEGNHTHTNPGMTVNEGGSLVDASVTTLDFDGSDFNLTESPEDTVSVALNYGSGAGQPAEGNHAHAAGGAVITVQEGDSDVDTAVTTLDFDASDFNVTSSPAGEANIALAYGTSAGTPAEGNHIHTETVGMTFILGDGVNVITSSEPPQIVNLPVAMTWTKWLLEGDVSGSITLEVDRAASGSPTSFSSIAGSEKPALSSSQTNSDTSPFSGGDTTTDTDDRLRISVSGSPASVKRIYFHLVGTRAV